MDVKDLRYIVFLLIPETQQYLGDQKIDTHEGTVFCSLKEAKEYAAKSIKDQYCSRFVIGVFVLEKDAESMGISSVETFGFRHDKKNVSQLDLFKNVR